MTTVDAPAPRHRLPFVGCFLALIATAFGFVVRAMLIDDWGKQFDLTDTQKGEILGVGLWPFAISIVLFSLVIDRIGYGRAMVFAFVCHVTSAVVTIFAKGYWGLWIGTFIVALDRKSTRLNSSHLGISYAVFCLKKKKENQR